MSARIGVLLLRPKEDGNVGAVARAARNFGAHSLGFVAPRAALGPEARRRAMGGLMLLRNARVYDDLDAALAESDIVVGTTDLSTGRSASYLRRSVSPERLGELCRSLDGRLALLFGPEDNGLSREELARCDLLVHIPARREFPTLNLSHAVAIVLYAIHRAQLPADPDSTPAPETLLLNGKEKELFLRRIAELLSRTGYPAHKRRGLALLMRRVLGRSTPTEAEYRMLLGLLKSVERLTRAPKGTS
ncbi:MAG: RNA methyltransferase [Thermoplasmata archaeon]|nr:RNA methyltransferase [Thermoplasmata archaeon]MCI4342210.1 RNA methyltransferase [Thermoplasmata archaeon]